MAGDGRKRRGKSIRRLEMETYKQTQVLTCSIFARYKFRMRDVPANIEVAMRILRPSLTLALVRRDECSLFRYQSSRLLTVLVSWTGKTNVAAVSAAFEIWP